MNEAPGISVVVPVSERADNTADLYREYKGGVEATGRDFEFVYVLDGSFPEVAATLEQLNAVGETIKIVRLARYFGEATALVAGFEVAEGERVLTLPAYRQIEAADIPKLIEALETADVVAAVRTKRTDSWLRRAQGRFFNWVVSTLTGQTFRDLGCGARAFRREVLSEINIYGDQHRFLPLLASRWGFRVSEVEVRHNPRDLAPTFYRPGIYIRRALDVLTVYFLVKFTKKPLRFFGLLGFGIAGIGGAVVAYLVVQRVLGYTELADRPALLLGSLLLVLGIQLFAIGLIGELLIFIHSRQIKEYRVEKTLNM
jgi:glycosyltransferase involved in cell wall biosynthesis